MSCADVCVSHDYVDCGPEFCTERYVRARHNHECCECRGTIPIGSLYHKVSGKWDGYMQTFRTCGPCAEIRDAFVCGLYEFGFLWESLYEGMFPVWRNAGPWDCLAKLTTPEAIQMCETRFGEWLDDGTD